MDRKKPSVDVQQVLDILADLYPNRAIALVRENLQNSIDGGARNVWIRTNESKRAVTFIDDGRGIPIGSMNEDAYFGLVWSTKKGGQLMIGGKGIGRLTNISVAKKVLVVDNDGQTEAAYSWYPDGTHEPITAPSLLGSHRGIALALEDVKPQVARDLESKVSEVAVDYFDDYLKRGVNIWFNGIRVEPKEFPGVKKTFDLRSGAQLELYWHAKGQKPGESGILLKCRGVKVAGPDRLGIDSSEWRNLAGILHLDRFKLTTNRDAFEQTPALQDAMQEAAAKVRAVLAHYEGGREKRLNAVATAYTEAARNALKKLNIDLTLLGGAYAPHPTEAEPELASRSPRQAQLPGDRKPPKSERQEGDRSGFRLVPKYFESDPELREWSREMSIKRGSEILVNLGHPACPKNKYARSYYIWGCCFAEIVRLGTLSVSEQLEKDRFIEIYRGWLQAWSPELARVTPGEE